MSAIFLFFSLQLDLIHAVKPEPDKEIPQAQTAHDNAWDFFSLTPESMHAVGAFFDHIYSKTNPPSFWIR